MEILNCFRINRGFFPTLQLNCKCLENITVSLCCSQVLVSKSLQENQPSFLSRHIEGCSFWENNSPSQIRSEKHVVRWATLFCLPPAVHGKAVCGDHEDIVRLSFFSTYCCTLKWLAKEFPFLSVMCCCPYCHWITKRNHNKQRKNQKKSPTDNSVGVLPLIWIISSNKAAE